ncbi:MAG: hypothetical protein ABL907_09690, partial [Hyphomicrobium sp.]
RFRVVTPVPHNLKVVGSNPAPATIYIGLAGVQIFSLKKSCYDNVLGALSRDGCALPMTA